MILDIIFIATGMLFTCVIQNMVDLQITLIWLFVCVAYLNRDKCLLERKVDKLENLFKTKFDARESQINALNQELEMKEKHLEILDADVDNLEHRLERHEKNTSSISSEKTDKQIAYIIGELDVIYKSIKYIEGCIN